MVSLLSLSKFQFSFRLTWHIVHWEETQSECETEPSVSAQDAFNRNIREPPLVEDEVRM